MLIAQGISYQYGPQEKVLEEVSFTLEQASMLGIIGPNGGGKSTLLKLMVGLLPLQKGTISLNGESLPRPHQVGYVAQIQDFNDALPVRVCDFLELLPQAPKRSLPETLERVGLSDKANALMRELSGGQRQRALLARALRLAPSLLILDEPTTGLDGQGQDQLMSLLKSLQEREKTTIVVVDHNLGQVLKHADKVLCLNRQHHWHNKRELLTQDILENIYHCEFEHIRLHEAGSQFDDHHHECDHDHAQHDHDHETKT